MNIDIPIRGKECRLRLHPKYICIMSSKYHCEITLLSLMRQNNFVSPKSQDHLNYRYSYIYTIGIYVYTK